MDINQDIQNLIRQAGVVLNDTLASSVKLGERAKDELYSNSQSIQEKIDKFLSTNGVLTQQELNELEEAIRIQKLKLLYFKSQKTKKRFLIIGGSAILLVAGVWYLTTLKK
jgi:hypothetical protein